MPIIDRVLTHIHTVNAASVTPVSQRYRAVLTGAPDAQPDLDLAPSSVSARLNDGQRSYITVVVPRSGTIVSDLRARLNGELVIWRTLSLSDGSETEIEFLRANFDRFSFLTGASSGAVTLYGTKQQTNLTPKTVSLERVGDESVNSEFARVLTVYDIVIAIPGDSVDLGGDDVFPIKSISLELRPAAITFTITEDVN